MRESGASHFGDAQPSGASLQILKHAPGKTPPVSSCPATHLAVNGRLGWAKWLQLYYKKKHACKQQCTVYTVWFTFQFTGVQVWRLLNMKH